MINFTTAKTKRRPDGTWNPLWLQKPVLLAFIFLFLAFSASLISIYSFSNRHDGLVLFLGDNRYTWTYGPTFVLTIVIALWRRVNYCAMANQPWQELHDGPRPAVKTVLLDYLGPLQIQSFFTALTNDHFAVVATISNFALLKITIVVSTTLFVLGPSLISGQASVRIANKFGDGDLWMIGSPNPPKITYEKNYSLDWPFLEVSLEPAQTYFNLAAMHRANTSIPLELSKTFTNFSVSPDTPGSMSRVSGQVDVFQSNATCELVTVEMVGGSTQMQRSACGLTKVPWHHTYWGGSTTINGTTKQYIGELAWCSPGVDYQYVLSAGISDFVNGTTTDPQLTTVSCKLGYSIHDGMLHLGRESATGVVKGKSIDIQGIKGKIANLTDFQFFEAVYSSLQLASSVLESPASSGRAFLSILGEYSPDGSLEHLFDGPTLQREAEKVWAGVGDQFARQYFLNSMAQEDNVTIIARTKYREPRLLIQSAAVYTMVAIFLITACITVAVLIYAKEGVAPKSPGTLSAMLSVLAKSPAMKEVTNDANYIKGQKDVFDRKLMAYEYFSYHNSDGVPRIEVSAVNHYNETKIASTKTEHQQENRLEKPWMPWSSHFYAMALTLLSPILAAVVLEILWWNNDKLNLARSDNSIAAYATRYISSAVALLIATLFGSLDSAIATLTPLSTLATSKNATWRRTMLFNITEELPPIALYKAIRQMHWGAALVLIASTAGSILTIIVSGLWYLDNSVALIHPAAGNIVSSWNVSFTADNLSDTANWGGYVKGIVAQKLYYNNFASAIDFFDKVQHGALDNATLIRDDIVLPTVRNALPLSGRRDDENGTQVTSLIVPALRPALECSIVPKSNITIHDNYYTSSIQLSRHCQVDQDEVPYQGATWDTGISLDFPKPDIIEFAPSHNEISFVGDGVAYLFDLPILPTSNSSRGCPSIGATIARSLGTGKSMEITSIICTQRLQSVRVNATYIAPQTPSSILTPDPSVPIRLASGTNPINLRDPQTGISSLTSAINEAFRKITMPFTGEAANRYETSRDDNGYSFFMDHLILGPDPTPFDQLFDPDILIAAVERLYQKAMVRVIDIAYRIEKNEKDATNNDNSTFATTKRQNFELVSDYDEQIVRGNTTTTISRLRVDRRSKTVLQAVLGGMAALGGLAYLLVGAQGMRRTGLPREPYSIAVRMDLLTDSTLLEMAGMQEREEESSLLDGSEAREGEVRRKKYEEKVTDMLLRLGWWVQDKGGDGSEMGATRRSQDKGDENGEIGGRPEMNFGIDILEGGDGEERKDRNDGKDYMHISQE